MKKIFFTPGPSALYPTVPSHFQKGLQEDIGSISHRSKQFSQIYEELASGLKQLLGIPKAYHIFIVGSGTEAMERTIQNCVEKYSFHFINGSFSNRFFVIAGELGKKPASVQVPPGQGFDFQHIVIPERTEFMCFTHNETSTGVMIPASEIDKIAKKYPAMLVAVDTVSSAPYGELDYKHLDVVFFSVQKLFGMPAGLGIMIVSPRAIKKSEELLRKGVSTGSYHNFSTLLKSAEKWQTPETPSVLEMFVLESVIRDMQKIGIKNIRKETEKKASLLYDFLDKSEKLSAFVKPAFRSPTVIVVDISKANKNIKNLLAAKGMIVGSGYGVLKEKQIRIANYPTHALEDVRRLIKELKTI
jgi:phosphoserine aminotransferase